jgi:hypothetical protein
MGAFWRARDEESGWYGRKIERTVSVTKMLSRVWVVCLWNLL